MELAFHQPRIQFYRGGPRARRWVFLSYDTTASLLYQFVNRTRTTLTEYISLASESTSLDEIHTKLVSLRSNYKASLYN